MLVRAFRFPERPVAAHIVPIRRCNLSCGYCNEFDDHSAPVPTGEMLRRIDRLAALGTGIVTMSGGEPLLHPDLDTLIVHVRARGMIATLITNGLLLTVDRIERLNRAGLDHLQISIDNVSPDEVSKKSLKVLDMKLEWLARHAAFDVVINAVVGAGTRRPDDALTIARRAAERGLSTTVGLIHDRRGQLQPLDARNREMLEAIVAMGRPRLDFANYNQFQRNLSHGRPNDWHCRAGGRYLYVCEDGLVHWCSQQRGSPAIPLERYAREDLVREGERIKGCAPFCTVGCVHRVAQVDALRDHPLETLRQWFGGAPVEGAPAGEAAMVAPRLPPAVRLLAWLFVTSPRSAFFRRTAVRLFGARHDALDSSAPR